MLIIPRESVKKKPNILKQTFLLLKLINDCETSISDLDAWDHIQLEIRMWNLALKFSVISHYQRTLIHLKNITPAFTVNLNIREQSELWKPILPNPDKYENAGTANLKWHLLKLVSMCYSTDLSVKIQTKGLKSSLFHPSGMMEVPEVQAVSLVLFTENWYH